MRAPRMLLSALILEFYLVIVVATTSGYQSKWTETGLRVEDGQSNADNLGQHELKCAIESETDKFFEWVWIPPTQPRSIATNQASIAPRVKSLLSGYYRLGLTISAQYSIDQSELGAKENATHKARVYFPFWEPTGNEDCSMSYKYNALNSSMIEHQKKNATYRWPRLSTVLIRPNKGQESVQLADVRLLHTFEHPNQLLEEPEVFVKIGKQTSGTWSVAILVETKIGAGDFEIGEIRLINCDPITKNDGGLIDLKQLFGSTCQDGTREFQCRLSGRCISLDYRCDYGHDCGPHDDSDEFRCPAAFEGRCDFEGSGCSEWVSLRNMYTLTSSYYYATTHQSWHHVQVDGSDQAGPLHDKPLLDHTYQSRRIEGHYMLVDAAHLDSYGNGQLAGPRVQLKEGHTECDFRFWVNTPKRLDGLGLTMPVLTVGYTRINATVLFDRSSSSLQSSQFATGYTLGATENGWRRFQVPIIRGGPHYVPAIFSLHITFGSLGTDLEQFAKARGYLALDDFSFSQGCAITYYNTAPANTCGDTEFRCLFPPEYSPDDRCIPLNRVCDFKPDCGHSSWHKPSVYGEFKKIADEARCLRRFVSSSDATPMAGLKSASGLRSLRDTQSMALLGFETNEAFVLEWPQRLNDETNSSSSSSSATPFVIRAQYEKFRSNLKKYGKESSQHLRDVGLILPRFHQAHANCKLALKYAWSADARNLIATLFLVRSNTRTLLKRFRSDEDANADADVHSSLLGLGEQAAPFNIYLVVTFESNEPDQAVDHDNLIRFRGSLSLFEYSFDDCHHLKQGRLSVPQAHSVQVADLNDDNDDDDDDDELVAQASSSSSSSSTQTYVKPNCNNYEFQCDGPIYCLNYQFVCDMQRDCQESGNDEGHCAERGFIQYNFETDHLLDHGWSMNQSAGNTWLIRNVDQELRAGQDLGPPVDHTTGLASGKFLTMSSHHIASVTRVFTPWFDVQSLCYFLVLYVYHWHPRAEPGSLEHADWMEYEILVRYLGSDGRTRDQILASSNQSQYFNNLDAWQRMAFFLPHTNKDCAACFNATQFSVGFHASAPVNIRPGAAMIAIDDVSLGPRCKLKKWPEPEQSKTIQIDENDLEKSSSSSSSSTLSSTSPLDGQTGGVNHSTLGWLLVTLVASVCGAGLIVYFNRMRTMRGQLQRGARLSSATTPSASDYAMSSLKS